MQFISADNIQLHDGSTVFVFDRPAFRVLKASVAHSGHWFDLERYRLYNDELPDGFSVPRSSIYASEINAQKECDEAIDREIAKLEEKIERLRAAKEGLPYNPYE